MNKSNINTGKPKTVGKKETTVTKQYDAKTGKAFKKGFYKAAVESGLSNVETDLLFKEAVFRGKIPFNQSSTPNPLTRLILSGAAPLAAGGAAIGGMGLLDHLTSSNKSDLPTETVSPIDDLSSGSSTDGGGEPIGNFILNKGLPTVAGGMLGYGLGNSLGSTDKQKRRFGAIGALGGAAGIPLLLDQITKNLSPGNSQGLPKGMIPLSQ
jgi:hypothetical protein